MTAPKKSTAPKKGATSASAEQGEGVVTARQPGELVTCTHRGTGAGRLQHGEYSIGAGETRDVPAEVFDIWASHTRNGEPLVVEGQASAKEVAATGEVAKLRSRNADLEQRLKNLERMVAASGGKAPKASNKPASRQLLEAGAPKVGETVASGESSTPAPETPAGS